MTICKKLKDKLQVKNKIIFLSHNLKSQNTEVLSTISKFSSLLFTILRGRWKRKFEKTQKCSKHRKNTVLRER